VFVLTLTFLSLCISVVKLVKNFRSHPAILKFPNERFYRGDLQACGSSKVINHFLALYPLVDKAKKFPIVFHSVSGKDDREGTSPSFFNIDEVIVVKTLIERLKANRRLRIGEAFCISVSFTLTGNCFL